jgi:hypothetical protein
MAQTNIKARAVAGKTHEGAPAMKENSLQTLRRVLNAHLLWEASFYMDGKDSASVLAEAVTNAATGDPEGTALVIRMARSEMKIRHASLMAAAQFAHLNPKPGMGRKLVTDVIQRADELAEMLAISQSLSGKIPHAISRGVRDAFGKFDEYQFGKYKGLGKAVTLRDAVFMTHPNPVKWPLVQKIVDDALAIPDTWETGLSAGGNKAKVFTDLLTENRLGAMALLRNLRGMQEAGVDKDLIGTAIRRADWARVLPFRFLSAMEAAPSFAPFLDAAFMKAVAGSVYLPGKTAVLLDTSSSMTGSTISARSKVKPMAAGAALAAAINGDEVRLFQWADRTLEIPNFRSLSSAFTMRPGMVGHGTHIGQALNYIAKLGFNRVIVISDMQFHEGASYGVEVPALAKGVKGYTINTSSYANPGLLRGDWTHFSGFSEAVLTFIEASEKQC